MIQLLTPRFLLRDFTEEDRAGFVGYQMHPRYRRLYDFDEGHGRQANALFDLFRSWRLQEPRRNFQLGIFERQTGRLCGCAGLRRDECRPDRAELGIELMPDDWGRYRLAVEVVQALLDFGFGDLGLETIVGSTASGNRRVERLARRFGAEIVASREGPEWMAARGWRETDWAVRRDTWRP
jgi:ribosomal-protein-alanine N-acetyltransferase